MSARLIFAPEAIEQAAVALAWWRENRPAAPELLADELRAAFARISAMPGSGHPLSHSNVPRLRRVLMRRVRYHVYYNADEAGAVVHVLAIWNAQRGRGPTLGAVEHPG